MKLSSKEAFHSVEISADECRAHLTSPFHPFQQIQLHVNKTRKMAFFGEGNERKDEDDVGVYANSHIKRFPPRKSGCKASEQTWLSSEPLKGVFKAPCNFFIRRRRILSLSSRRIRIHLSYTLYAEAVYTV